MYVCLLYLKVVQILILLWVLCCLMHLWATVSPLKINRWLLCIFYWFWCPLYYICVSGQSFLQVIYTAVYKYVISLENIIFPLLLFSCGGIVHMSSNYILHMLHGSYNGLYNLWDLTSLKYIHYICILFLVLKSCILMADDGLHDWNM